MESGGSWKITVDGEYTVIPDNRKKRKVPCVGNVMRIFQTLTGSAGLTFRGCACKGGNQRNVPRVYKLLNWSLDTVHPLARRRVVPPPDGLHSAPVVGRACASAFEAHLNGKRSAGVRWGPKPHIGRAPVAHNAATADAGPRTQAVEGDVSHA